MIDAICGISRENRNEHAVGCPDIIGRKDTAQPKISHYLDGLRDRREVISKSVGNGLRNLFKKRSENRMDRSDRSGNAVDEQTPRNQHDQEQEILERGSNEC